MEAHMKINKGDVFFASYYEEDNEIIHPCVIYELINENEFKICMISTNMKKAYWPGNIVLNDNEAGLPKKSIVIVSKTKISKLINLKEYIGRFSLLRTEESINEIEKLNCIVGQKEKG
jgi:mRNA interferase MazF